MSLARGEFMSLLQREEITTRYVGRQKSTAAFTILVEGFLSKRRSFDLPECGGCIYKGGSYCWGQCSFNVWKRDRE